MRPSPRRVAAGLGLLLLVAALFVTRFWRLDAPSLWEDDYLNLDRALMPPAAMFAVQKYLGPADTIFDIQPPLSYALDHLFLAVKESSLAARLPSALAGLLMPFGLLLLGRRLLGRGVGLVAFGLSIFLLYPINFSQAIKPYALFLCLTVYSMWFLVRAVSENARRLWIGYGLCALGMLYAGYQGFPTFAAQFVFAFATCHRRARGEDGPVRRGRWMWLLAIFGGVFAAYLPWLPSIFFLGTFLHAPSVDPWAGLGPAFATKILRGFISFDPETSLAFVLGWAAVAGLGLWAGLRDRRWEALALLGLWVAAGSLTLLSSKTLLRPLLESRHFIMVFPALVLLTARGVVWIRDGADAALARFSADRSAGAVLAGLLCLGLLWPSLAGYDAYYHRTMSLDREFFQWLDAGRGDADALEFHGYKRNTRRFAAHWYLPGRFADAGTFEAPGYRVIGDIDTFYSEDAATRPTWPGLPVKEFSSLFTTTRVTVGGLANRSPLVMDPGPGQTYRYADDFRSKRFYEDAGQAKNMSLDTEIGMLRPARYTQPAEATWVFEVPAGLAARDLRLDVAAALYKKHPGLPAGSTLTMAAGPDGKQYTTLGVIGQDDFSLQDGRAVEVGREFFDEIGFYDGRCRETKAAFAVDPGLAAGGRLFIKVSYQPGRAEGFLNLSGLGLTAGLEPTGQVLPPPLSRDAPLALQAGHLLRNVRAARWREDGDATAIGRFAFAAPGFESLAETDLPMGTPGERARFLELNPGLAPVHTLADATGRPAVYLYDPSLTRPGIQLAAQAPGGRVLGLPPFGDAPASLRLTGNIVGPTLRIGGQTLAIPVLAPRGATLTLTPGGRGRIHFVPDWTGAGDFQGAMSYAREVAASGRLRGELTCRGEGECAFAYTVVSGLPITELRLKVFPQVYANPCRRCEPNEARVSLSTDDGKTWKPLVRELGEEECAWTSPAAYVTRRVAFEHPVTQLRLAFELEQGSQAGFLSPSWNVDGMYVEVDLDASSLPRLHLDGPDATVSLVDPGPNDFTLFLRPGPWPLSDRTAEP